MTDANLSSCCIAYLCGTGMETACCACGKPIYSERVWSERAAIVDDAIAELNDRLATLHSLGTDISNGRALFDEAKFIKTSKTIKDLVALADILKMMP